MEPETGGGTRGWARLEPGMGVEVWGKSEDKDLGVGCDIIKVCGASAVDGGKVRGHCTGLGQRQEWEEPGQGWVESGRAGRFSVGVRWVFRHARASFRASLCIHNVPTTHDFHKATYL